jgi:hypothetical protein
MDYMKLELNSRAIYLEYFHVLTMENSGSVQWISQENTENTKD